MGVGGGIGGGGVGGGGLRATPATSTAGNAAPPVAIKILKSGDVGIGNGSRGISGAAAEAEAKTAILLSL